MYRNSDLHIEIVESASKSQNDVETFSLAGFYTLKGSLFHYECSYNSFQEYLVIYPQFCKSGNWRTPPKKHHIYKPQATRDLTNRNSINSICLGFFPKGILEYFQDWCLRSSIQPKVQLSCLVNPISDYFFKSVTQILQSSDKSQSQL